MLIALAAILLAAVFTAIYGRVYDKKGFAVSVLPSLALLMAGYVALFFFRSMVPVFLGTLIMMCGFLGTGAVIGAKVRTHTPANKSGMFQGLRIFGQVLIPGVIGPYIGSFVLRNAETIVNGDGTVSFIPNANIFLAAFVVGLFIWVTLIPLCKKEK